VQVRENDKLEKSSRTRIMMVLRHYQNRHQEQNERKGVVRERRPRSLLARWIDAFCVPNNVLSFTPSPGVETGTIPIDRLAL